MLKFQIKEVILARGILHPHRFLVKHCGIPHVSAINLLSGKQKSLNLNHLSSICANLNITPNDLIYYSTSNNGQNSQHLRIATELVQRTEYMDWEKLLKELPPNKVEELRLQAETHFKDKLLK